MMTISIERQVEVMLGGEADLGKVSVLHVSADLLDFDHVLTGSRIH